MSRSVESIDTQSSPQLHESAPSPSSSSSSDSDSDDDPPPRKKQRTKHGANYTLRQMAAAIAAKLYDPFISKTQIQQRFGELPKSTFHDNINKIRKLIQEKHESVEGIIDNNIPPKKRRTTLASVLAELSSVQRVDQIERVHNALKKLREVGRNEQRKSTQHFTMEEERKLEEWAVQMSEVGLALPYKTFKAKVLQCLQIKYTALNIMSMPKLGKNWIAKFIKRSSRLTSRAMIIMDNRHVKAVRKDAIENFLSLFHLQLTRLSIKDPRQLLAFDATGFSSIITADSKLRIEAQSMLPADVGRKLVATGPETGSSNAEHISLVHICDAAGDVFPPFCVFSSRSINLTKIDNRLGSRYLTSENGSLMSYQFVEVINFINEQAILKNIPKPLLLLCDVALVHFDVQMLERARELQIHIITLPANTTKLAQLQHTFSKYVFAKFKKLFKRKACENYETMCEKVHPSSFTQILNTIWEEANNPNDIRKGFAKLGYWPFNPNCLLSKAGSKSSSSSSSTIGDEEDAVLFEPVDDYKQQDIIDLQTLKSQAVTATLLTMHKV